MVTAGVPGMMSAAMIESLEVPPPSAPRGLAFRVGFVYWINEEPYNR